MCCEEECGRFEEGYFCGRRGHRGSEPGCASAAGANAHESEWATWDRQHALYSLYSLYSLRWSGGSRQGTGHGNGARPPPQEMVHGRPEGAELLVSTCNHTNTRGSVGRCRTVEAVDAASSDCRGARFCSAVVRAAVEGGTLVLSNLSPLRASAAQRHVH